MAKIDDLPIPEKRKLLFLSRLRFGIETKIPRQKAVDRIIENALFILGPEGSFTAKQVMDVFREIGKVPTLRIGEIEDGLKRLIEDRRVIPHHENIPRRYSLSKSAAEDSMASYSESSRRFDRVTDRLFGNLEPSVRDTSASLFLEFVCEIFSALGAQWVSYINGQPIDTLINRDRVEELAETLAHKRNLSQPLRGEVKRRCIQFLTNSDPDYDYLKFTLGQSFYIVHLLGVEGHNLLSEEIFSGGRLYLDSSVVIPALLGASRHHIVFQELVKICRRLGIELFVTRPTVDEVRAVAAQQEQLAPTLYDEVPERLASRVFGDFFQTYHSIKQEDPTTTPEQLFAPFHQLSDTLRKSLGIAVIDHERFDKFPDQSGFQDVKDVLQAASNETRKRKKFENALIHDAKTYLFLRSECTSPNDKIWFVTRDSSLPKAWSLLQPHGLAIRCFLLDGLLQSISPFVVDDGEIKDLSEVFSQVVAAQLIPQGKIFDIEDFLLLQDLQIDCNELPGHDLEDALLSIKSSVLKGAAYRHENLEEAAYELRRILRGRDKRSERMAAQLNELEQKLDDQRTKHSDEETALRTEIERLKAKHAYRSQTLRMLLKKGAFYAVLIGSIWLLGKIVDRWGSGENFLQKLASDWFLFPVDIALILGLGKVFLFRKQKLREVFSFWHEVKELFS